MEWACAVLYCRTSLVRLHPIFPHYLINGTIFGKITEYKMCVLSLSKLLSETFIILRSIQQNIINPQPPSCKVSVFLVKFKRNLNFLDIFSKHTQMSNFMTIRPVGAEFFHADRQRDSQIKRRTVVDFRNFMNTLPNKRVLFFTVLPCILIHWISHTN